MTPLTIVANIIARANKIDLVKDEIEKLVAITRTEKGCIQYDLHQDNENPAHFMIYENWESKKLWKEHMDSEHLAAYREATKGTIEKFKVNKLSRLF